MTTVPPNQLPVCAYDGHCYRKNPLHFQQYTHPLQYPQPSSDTASTKQEEEPDMPPPKRGLSDEHADHSAEDVQRQEKEPKASPLRETDPATPEQVLYFLSHPPHLAAVVSAEHASDDGAAAEAEDDKHSNKRNTSSGAEKEEQTLLPRIDVNRRWSGVAEVLQHAYGGMHFHAEDVQCVLTAACTLNPAAPLAAFPEWRLVGPFDLAWRYGQLCAGDCHADAKGATAVEKLTSLLHGRSTDDEVHRWRCGRFRYDPPECQTVAVRVTPVPPSNTAATTTTTSACAAAATELNADGTHLCLHRDDPSTLPGMLVEGTACSPKFTVVNGNGWLAPYLCAGYCAKGNAASLAVAQALEDAADTLAAQRRSTALAQLRKCLHEPLSTQRKAYAARQNLWTAKTYSGLGIWVPVNKKTQTGYRKPEEPDGISFANCLRDCEADFVASGDDVQSNTGAGNAAAATTPFSRSSDHARLQKARKFTTNTSEKLDSVFLWADVANDEGDFGTSLELGLNCLSCVLADTCVMVQKKVNTQGISSDQDAEATKHDASVPLSHAHCVEQRKADPVLWHTYRLLDCAYMLLQRSLYRHILRCHLPLLADAGHPVLLDVTE